MCIRDRRSTLGRPIFDESPTRIGAKIICATEKQEIANPTMKGEAPRCTAKVMGITSRGKGLSGESALGSAAEPRRTVNLLRPILEYCCAAVLLGIL
eukprot:3835324-Rhodomonas_salina.1